MSILPVNDSIQARAVTMDQLPTDLQRMILRYLDPDTLKQARLVCSSFRDSVKDITYSSFCRQCDKLLVELHPYFSEDNQEYLEELLTQFRQGVQVVAGIPLAFDTKNARMVFRQELIKFLVDSPTLLELRCAPLFQESFLQFLPEEFKHLPCLISFMQIIKETKSDPTLTNDEKLSRYRSAINRRFDSGFSSEIMMRDVIKLVDLEVLKLLIGVLLRRNYSVALEAVGYLPLPDQDQFLSAIIEALIVNRAFDKVEPMIQFVSSPEQDHVVHNIIQRIQDYIVL